MQSVFSIALIFLHPTEAEDSEFRPPEAELDEYHHKATRTLFIGNLEKDIEPELLRKKFSKYGFILVSIAELNETLHV